MQPAIAEHIRAEEPDLVLVYGDTNSTLAGARAAADASIPLAHVEAGLRSGDLSMPEEHNRIETDRLAWLLFCPDDRSQANAPGRRRPRSDLRRGRRDGGRDARLRSARADGFPVPHEPGSYVVATIHRQANVEQPRLGHIVEGLNRIDGMVVFPVHPRTRARIEEEGLALGSHIRAIEPLSYLELASLASQARVIVTDSGGLQKEAYWYGSRASRSGPRPNGSTRWRKARTCSSTPIPTHSHRRSPRPRFHPAAPCCTGTGTPRSGSRRCSSLRSRPDEARRCHRRSRLRRRSARTNLRRRGQAACCSSTSTPRALPSSTPARATSRTSRRRC